MMREIIDGGVSKGQARLKVGWKALDVIGTQQAVKGK
jgi:hypothetical protein